MSNVIKQGLRQQQRTLSERITALEQGLAQVLYKINQRFGSLDTGLVEANEKIEALIELLSSTDEVQRVVQRKRLEQAQAQVEREKAALAEGVKEGYLVMADKVGERSLITGRYIDASGKVEEPGHTQLAIPGVALQFKEKLLGQSVGTFLDLPTGGKFELVAIFEVDDAKYKEVMEARAKAQADAAQKAAEVQGNADETQDTAADQGTPVEGK